MLPKLSFEGSAYVKAYLNKMMVYVASNCSLFKTVLKVFLLSLVYKRKFRLLAGHFLGLFV